MGKSKIEWTQATWNPMSGCTKISAGCANCYAETMAYRLKAMGTKGYENGFAVTLHPEKLSDPLKHKKPTMYFVCSMGDLFHEDVPFDYIDQIFAIMALTPQHTYQVLTKRPERMNQYMENPPALWPLPNVWLGVTAENQEQADKRIPILIDTPAAVRFVSIEPMLGEINLQKLHRKMVNGAPAYPCNEPYLFDLDWVIVGGETGANARPMHPDWVRSIKEQCEEAKVPFFFKQWGEFNTLPQGKSATGYKSHFWQDGRQAVQVGKKQAGHLLDGVEYREMPEAGNEK